jgi:CheY-like chemotaxis protein/HPt (histidine-containing phosphotransfer) domain-containing protein
MLESWHMQPDVVDTGAAGLSAMAQAHGAHDPFGLVVLDGQMPEMDGFELARRIRHDRRFESTPIIMLTSMGRPGDVARSRKVGISAYLTKPVKHSDLLDAIVTLCGTRDRRMTTSERVPAGADVTAGTRPRTAHQTAAARKLRILLAEDNAVNRKLIQNILRKRGHDMVAAEDGRRAVRAVARATRPFDLVLMDVQMPDMGGLEATAAIREHERTTGSHVPIVAMTAHAMSGDREECLRAGMDGYLSKPILAQQLIEAVERHAAAPAHADDAAVPAERNGLGAGPDGLDEALALARVNGDRRLLREVAGLFLSDYPRTLRALRRAVRANDAAGTHAAAHALKGAIAIFGGRTAVESALALQQMGKTGRLAGAQATLDLLESRLAALRLELAALTRRQPSSARATARRRGTTGRQAGAVKRTAKRR